MKLQIDATERSVLTAELGLAANASDSEIAVAVAKRLTGVSSFESGQRRAAPPAPAASAGYSMDPDAEATIATAIRDGKFAGERADHYRQRWARDPDGTRRTIARLAPGAVLPPLPAAGADDAYPAV